MTRKARGGTTTKARAAPPTRPPVAPAGEAAIDAILHRSYSWVVAQDPNGRFSARVAELPGCATDGATRAEALKNLEDAAHDWVKGALEDGFPIPEPREREGASGKVLLRLPRKLHRHVQDLAASEGVSANTFIIAALSTHVGAVTLANNVLKQIRRALAHVIVRASSASGTSPAVIAAGSITYDEKNSALTTERPGYLQ
jgi:predicted RNase H-like HicB family nuclease